MNTVEPIRDKAVVSGIAAYLKSGSERNHLMFMMGIYSGLRISDILKLRVLDVKDKKHIYIREMKTGKEKRFKINSELEKIIKRYIKDMREYEYLFQSRKGSNKPITRRQAYDILNEAGSKFGLESIGTHSLRKTFGYHLYKETKNIVELQKIFNHADIATTLRYIGVDQDSRDELMESLRF